MQTALDLSAVYETVNVESVDSLSGWTSCATANWEEDEEEEEEEKLKIMKYSFKQMTESVRTNGSGGK